MSEVLHAVCLWLPDQHNQGPWFLRFFILPWGGGKPRPLIFTVLYFARPLIFTVLGGGGTKAPIFYSSLFCQAPNFYGSLFCLGGGSLQKGQHVQTRTPKRRVHVNWWEGRRSQGLSQAFCCACRCFGGLSRSVGPQRDTQQLTSQSP